MSSWTYLEPFQSSKTKCHKCEAPLSRLPDPPSEITVYTRDGTKFVQHYGKECSNHWCRIKYYHGYTTYNGEKVYDDLTEETKYIVTSSETAYSVDYLYEVKLHILHSNATFQALSDVYNQLHNFQQSNIKRKDLNRKRLADGFFLYGLLEFGPRSGICPIFNTTKTWIDDSLKRYDDIIKKEFSKNWTDNHQCEVENCETGMISDGGMKINRAVCAHKFSMLRLYNHSKKYVLTGCVSSPSSDSPFCAKHRKLESPVLLAESVSSETRKKLKQYRAKSSSTPGNVKIYDDNIYCIEKILKRSGTNFLVKFSGFPESEACWEPKVNLPTFIVKHYDNKDNIGGPLPNPTITPLNQAGKDAYFQIDWTSGTGEKLRLEDNESLFDLDADKLSDEVLKSTCNTRKNKDKRDRRHTAGILISSRPCGIIPHVDELFGCESINQVHGSIIEFYGGLSQEARDKIKIWMFDDMCHLDPHSKKEEVANQNHLTKQFANLKKCVDNFHFPGHKKSDQFCQENYNPAKVMKELGISKINSPACEQAFTWINRFKNLKTMNEGRFKFFLLYMLDLHNLHIEKKVQKVSNPLNIERKKYITVSKAEPNLTEKLLVENDDTSVEKLVEEMSKVEISVKLETCYTEQAEKFLCKFCTGIYKMKGHLKTHLEVKHNKIIDLSCDCGKVFCDMTKLGRHVKNCNNK